MGKCIICGNETQNLYDYYSGDYSHSETVDRKYDTSGKIYSVSEIKHYTDLRKHSEHLCSKHIVNEEYSALWGVMILLIFFCPIALIVFIIQLVNGNGNFGDAGNIISLIAFMGITPVILSIIAFLIRKNKANKDIKCDENKSAEKIISKIKRITKKNDRENKRYFTPSEYSNLR